MNKTIFITGGMGFIGQKLVQALENEASHIYIFDNLHPQIHGENPVAKELPANATLIIGDVRDSKSLLTALENAKPHHIIHLASETGTGQSFDEISRYCDVNVMGTANLIECIRKLEIKPLRVLLASSRAIYGEGPYASQSGEIITGITRDSAMMRRGQFGILDENGNELNALPAKESTCPSPCSIYASTKLSQEQILELGLAPLGVPYSILRLQNVYGPGQSLNNPYTGVLSIMSRQILEDKELNIYEDGLMIRDFVFVEDVVSAFIAAMNTDNHVNHKLNIGSGTPINIFNTVKILIKLLGGTEGGYKISGFFREGDIRHSIGDISKALSELNWEPKCDIEAGLSSLANWAKSEISNC